MTCLSSNSIVVEHRSNPELLGEVGRPKRVVMIAYAYPPVLTSGSNRSVAFSKGLPDYGWEPTILTVEKNRSGLEAREAIPENIRIVRSWELNLYGLVDFLHGGTRRALRLVGIEVRRNWYREFLCVPDAHIAWLCLPRGILLARSHDVVYVSCPPFSSAIVGALIKLVTGKPLVIDLRDAWSLNPHAEHSRFYQTITRRLERFVLGLSDKVIVNTAGAASLYKKHYPQWEGRFLTIPNGYDTLNLAVPETPASKFTIMHVGSFYGSRLPDTLVEVLTEIANPQIEFVQVGGQFEGNLDIRPGIRIVPSLPHDEALAMMRSASLLYLKQGFETPTTNYIAVAAKTYEYLATGIPILADCPEGDNVDIVRRYCARPYVVTSGNSRDLKAAILRAFSERESVTPEVRDDFKITFARSRLTERLAAVFDEVTAAIGFANRGALKEEY